MYDLDTTLARSPSSSTICLCSLCISLSRTAVLSRRFLLQRFAIMLKFNVYLCLTTHNFAQKTRTICMELRHSSPCVTCRLCAFQMCGNFEIRGCFFCPPYLFYFLLNRITSQTTIARTAAIAVPMAMPPMSSFAFSHRDNSFSTG